MAGEAFDLGNLKSGFQQGQERPEHYEAIGRVVASFASIEIETHYAFAELVGIPRYLINPVMGGSRWVDVVTQIKAVLKKKPHPKADMILSGIEKCRMVKQVRDVVAHWTWSYRDDLMLFTNHWFAKDTDLSQYRLYSIKYLHDVASFPASLPLAQAFRPFYEEDDGFFPPEVLEELRQGLQARLNAVFPEPSHPEVNNPSTVRKPRTPRRSSHQKS